MHIMECVYSGGQLPHVPLACSSTLYLWVHCMHEFQKSWPILICLRLDDNMMAPITLSEHCCNRQ